MGDLYRLANRVVVWLGPEKKDSGHGVRLLRQLSTKVTVNWFQQTIEPISIGTASIGLMKVKGCPMVTKDFVLYIR